MKLGEDPPATPRAILIYMLMFLSIGIDHWADHTIDQNYSTFLTDDGLESNKHIWCWQNWTLFMLFFAVKTHENPFGPMGIFNVPGRRHGNVLQSRFVDLPFCGLCGQLLLGLRSWLKWHGYSMSLGFSENHILAYPIFSRKCDIFWESHSIFYWEKGLCTSTTHFMAISQRNTQRVPGRSRWRAAWRRKEPEQMKLGPLAKGQL